MMDIRLWIVWLLMDLYGPQILSGLLRDKHHASQCKEKVQKHCGVMNT